MSQSKAGPELREIERALSEVGKLRLSQVRQLIDVYLDNKSSELIGISDKEIILRHYDVAVLNRYIFRPYPKRVRDEWFGPLVWLDRNDPWSLSEGKLVLLPCPFVLVTASVTHNSLQEFDALKKANGGGTEAVRDRSF